MGYYYHRLTNLREDRSQPLTQHDIAVLLKTTLQTFSLWERGNREIPLHHAITLAKFYNVSHDYIADNKQEKQQVIEKISTGSPH